MLTSSSPPSHHLAQNLALVAVAVNFLPIVTTVLLLSYAVYAGQGFWGRIRDGLNQPLHSGHRAISSPTRTILVTGVGMTKGLYLARTFHLAGHNVIGADFEPYHIPVCGRFSRALKRYYALPTVTEGEDEGAAAYTQELLHIIRRERVDLWVSCSGVASALEDGRAMEIVTRRMEAKCVQFDVATTARLHGKDAFIAYTQSLGLPVPETHTVKSRDAVHKVLHQSPRTKKSYILKSVGVDDASRGDMTVLPRRTLSETYGHVARVPFGESKPWVLQQFVKGMEYCTHALIVRGAVRAFVACPSSDMLMHYEALPAERGLQRSLSGGALRRKEEK